MGTPEKNRWMAEVFGLASLQSAQAAGDVQGGSGDGQTTAPAPSASPGAPAPSGPSGTPAPGAPSAPPPAAGAIVIDQFGFDKADVPSIHKDKLKALAERLAASPDATAKLTGHTDTVGKEAYNRDLGQRRADAVRNFLINEGKVAAGRVTADTAGELIPAAGQPPAKRDPDKGEPNPKNRRVEIVISGDAPAGGSGPGGTPQPSPKPPDPPPHKPPGGIPRLPPDYQVDPPVDPNSPPLDPRMNRPIPPPVKRGRSFWEWVDETFIDPVANKIADGLKLSKEKRKKLKELMHDAIEKGVTTGLDSALDELGLSGSQKDAVKNAIEGALKTNPNDPGKSGQ
jgi:outer membrane protein OmpA-like peptidoglycan-associated protein